MTVSNNLKTVSKLALLKIALYLDRTEDAENLLDSSKLKTINTNNWEKQMLYALNNKDRDFKILIFFLKLFYSKFMVRFDSGIFSILCGPYNMVLKLKFMLRKLIT